MEQIINSRGTGLDRDSSIQNMAPGDSDYRLNCIYDVSDDSALGDVQNVRSNVKRNYTQPPGDNLTIGSCKDLERNAIIYFVWNSLGWHEIRRFFVDTKLTQTILRHPILNFQRNKKITGANVVQDLLYWTDGHDNGFQDFNPPRKLNLERAAAFTASAWYFTDNGFFSGNVGFVSNVPHGLQVGDVIMIDQFAGFSNASYNGQTTVTAVPNPTTIVTGLPFGVNTPPQGGTIHLATSLEYWRIDNVVLDRIKHPPLLCPTFTIQSEQNNKNLLYGNLFQFFYRYIYDDYEQSVFSPYSKITLFQNENSDGEYELNTENRIDVIVNTGHETVIRVEVAIRDVAGSYRVVRVIEKYDRQGNILVPSGINFTYLFYNDNSEKIIPSSIALKQFDYVPQISDCQELIEGNRIVDGNIVEGYDNIDIDLSLNLLVDKISNIPIDQKKKFLSFPRKSAFAAGIIYRDRGGRTAFVQTNDNSRIEIPPYFDPAIIAQYFDSTDPWILSTNQRTRLEWRINHVPPEWAESYDLVFTRDLYNAQKSVYFTQWGAAVGNEDNIHNLGSSTIQVPSNVGYSFSEGDRIRMIGTNNVIQAGAFLGVNSSTIPLPTGYGIRTVDTYDSDPTWSGNPWISGTYDFLVKSFDESTGVLEFVGEMNIQTVYTYIFEIYAPRKSSDTSEPFFEIGESFRIIDPGTPNRRHAGQIQDQTTSQPAIGIVDGIDCFVRRKKIRFENQRIKFHTSFIGEPFAGGRAVHFIFNIRANSNIGGLPYNSNNPQWAIAYPNLGGQVNGPCRPAILNMYAWSFGTLGFGIPGYVFYSATATATGFLDEVNTLSGITGDGRVLDGATSLNGIQPLLTDPAVQYIATQFPDEPYLVLAFGTGYDLYGAPIGPASQTAVLTLTTQHNQDEGSGDQFVDLYYWLESQSFSDYYSSEFDNTGRPYVADVNGARRRYKARIRYGGKLFQDSFINEIPTFDFEGRLDLSDRYNEITRIREIGYMLKVRQRNKNTSIYVGRTETRNADGSSNLITIDSVLGTVNPSEEIFGSYSPATDMRSVRDGYFLDLTNGVVVRDAYNGMVAISGNENSPVDPYKMSRHFRDLSNQIKEQGEEFFNIHSVWDDSNKFYILTVVDLRREIVGRPSLSQTIVFHEPTNRWKSFMNFIPEWYENVGQSLVAFKDGDLWEMYKGIDFNNFFGVQYDQEYAVVCNVAPDSIKAFGNIDIYSNLIWEAPEITIPPNTLYPNGMLSRLRPGRFVNREGKFHAQFLRDMNTPGQPVPALALQNGRMLRGEAIRVLLKNSHNTLVKLRDVVIHFAKSEKSV